MDQRDFMYLERNSSTRSHQAWVKVYLEGDKSTLRDVRVPGEDLEREHSPKLRAETYNPKPETSETLLPNKP